MYQWPKDDSAPPVGMFLLGSSAPADFQTYVMYHGTSTANAKTILASGFRRSPNGMLGPGVYLSRDLEKARYYPVNHPEHDKVVIKVSVNVGRVITIDCKNHPRQRNWHDYRCGVVYDTAWIPPRSELVRGDLEVDCVWDPNQIRIIKTFQPSQGYGYGAQGYQ